MLYEESIWIGKELLSLLNPGDALLNIGSSSLEMRQKEQPHIQKYIFDPLINTNIKIINVDIKDSEGVDIVGDITEQDVVNNLKLEKFNAILCSNLLEHVHEKEKIIKAIEDLLSENCAVIITVPYNYPYHLDPIDTMFRPTVKELVALFPSCNLKKGEIVVARSANKGIFEKNYFQKLTKDSRMLFLIFLRLLLPFYKYQIWKKNFFGIKNLFKDFSATCVVLIKRN